MNPDGSKPTVDGAPEQLTVSCACGRVTLTAVRPLSITGLRCPFCSPPARPRLQLVAP